MEKLLVKDEQEVEDYSEVTLEENQAPSPPFRGLGRDEVIQGRLEILENDMEVVVKRAKRRGKPRGLQISEEKLLGNPEVLQSQRSGIQRSSSSQGQNVQAALRLVQRLEWEENLFTHRST